MCMSEHLGNQHKCGDAGSKPLVCYRPYVKGRYMILKTAVLVGIALAAVISGAAAPAYATQQSAPRVVRGDGFNDGFFDDGFRRVPRGFFRERNIFRDRNFFFDRGRRVTARAGSARTSA